MKAQFKALTMACIMAAGTIAAAPAFAAHATPVSTTFSATGPTSLSVLGVPVPCTSNFVLVTDASGNVTVTQATFSGSATCTSVHATGLPWSASFSSTTAATISGVSVSTPFGSCSGSVGVAINNAASQISLSGTLGICSVSGTLTVAPTFTVVN
ncbi:hypothetical protein [Dyella sp.]|uniref:hypothetical protein n=1 Tax=Dyella sp. TaxID=1869338 RepID=UPI002ED18F6E